MQRSSDHILTTHVGSLIRPEKLLEFIGPLQAGKPYDETAYAACLTESVAEIVREQTEAGIDVVSDGEFGKSISWSQYALERLSGFEKRVMPADENSFAQGADRERFSEFYEELDGEHTYATVNQAVCVGPIDYTGIADVERDIANFKAALAQSGATEGFLPVAAPSSVIPDRINEYYATEDDCIEAIGKAMSTEYRAIVDSGLLLQLDDARATVTYDRMVPPGTFEEYRDWVAKHVEILNLALEGIPPEKIRYHVCWGSWPGPHTTDVALRDIADLILKVNAGAYVIEGANPRHEHEWKVWGDIDLPEDKILIHGVISHSTNVVEHPELVAERIIRVAKLLGRERVIAGTDCGFAQGPFYRRVHPSIMWAKFDALVEGARLASKELWG
ncbi:MAG: cobalamin-independent methionine synthase II family protein [Rhodospirillaceae bacterium]|jgi:5-methyltetrahydropteroyltriglutamate--homocysteine methyltransferase|nr:cobalamin-independent methionine synthase II family protein [Rhodospirillaceae bacterium]